MQTILKTSGPEQLGGFKIDRLQNGSRIFYKEALRKATNSKREVIVDRFMLEYSVKGPNPDFVVKALRNTMQYKHWMLNKTQVTLLNQIDENSDIIQLEAPLSVCSFIPVKSRLRLIRSAFFDQTSRSYVVAFNLIRNNSKHLEDLFLFISLTQVFDKTCVRIYLES